MMFILSYIVIILFVIIYLLDGIIMLFTKVKNRKWFIVTSERKLNKSLKIDIIANWLFPDTWNFLFGKKGSAYGVFGESISSVLGKRRLESRGSLFGWFMYYFLYVIDYINWRKGGHCVNAIMSEVEIKEFLKRR